MANSLLYEGASSPASRNAYFHQSLALAAMCFALTSNSLINSQRGTPIDEAVFYADGAGQRPSEGLICRALIEKGRRSGIGCGPERGYLRNSYVRYSFCRAIILVDRLDCDSMFTRR